MTWTLSLWAFAWAAVFGARFDLWPVALFGFLQNVAFTFTSRARNSESIGYHAAAALFSNGIYAVLLVGSIKLAPAGDPFSFLFVYTFSTLSGSVWAHQLALKKEKKWRKQK